MPYKLLFFDFVFAWLSCTPLEGANRAADGNMAGMCRSCATGASLCQIMVMTIVVMTMKVEVRGTMPSLRTPPWTCVAFQWHMLGHRSKLQPAITCSLHLQWQQPRSRQLHALCISAMATAAKEIPPRI